MFHLIKLKRCNQTQGHYRKGCAISFNQSATEAGECVLQNLVSLGYDIYINNY